MKTAKKSEDVVLAALEREQQRIGAALHETLCQTLAGVSIQVEVMTRHLQAGKHIKPSDLVGLGSHIHEVIEQTRALAVGLLPQKLQGVGLMQALDKLAETTAKEVLCEYICEKPVFPENARAARALYHIAEEAVGNAVKHAAAKKITISIVPTPAAIVLKINDDGRGFPPAVAHRASHGLRLMRRHARAAGAKLKIVSERGRGTVVSCILPQRN